MTSIAFPRIGSKVKLPNGTTYGYVQVKPSGDKPHILLLHGFPSSAYDWRHQIDFLAKEGYGVIAPDLIGYGATDKPKDLEAYKLKKMVADITALLDALDVEKVIAVGHDWGCGPLSRLPTYHPDRVLAYVFMDVGYQAPNGLTSIDEVNEMTTKMIGYPVFGYWHFFTSADAAELMERNPECTNSSIFPDDPSSMKTSLSLPGAARTWFEESKLCPIASWFTPEEQKIHNEIFAPENGGYGPPLNWYKCQMANLNAEDEANVPEERKVIEQPTLLMTCRNDPLGIPALAEMGTKPFVKNLEIKEVETGHWLQLEKPDEVNRILKEFIEGLKLA